MGNRQSEEKLLSMQSSKSTHPVSKLKGPAAIYFNDVTQDPPSLKAVQKSDGGRWANIIFIKYLQRLQR